MIAWFDMDGTLADDRWRRHYALHPDGVNILDHPNWGAYLAGESEDPPVQRMMEIFKTHWATPDTIVSIVTGRLFANIETLREWMAHHGVRGDYSVAMRADPTMDPLEFKAAHLEAMQAIGMGPNVAYDDRDDMLAMFAEAGVRTVDAKIYWDEGERK